MQANGIVGIYGIDTRALVRHLRDHGAQDGIISTGTASAEELAAKAKASPGLVGQDLVKNVTCHEPYDWNEGMWQLVGGYKRRDGSSAAKRSRKGSFHRAEILRRRLRLWHQIQHPAQSRRIGLPGARGAGVDAGERGAGAESRWNFSFQRSRRSRRGSLCQRKRPTADRQETDLRHLPGASNYWVWPWAARLTNSSLAIMAAISR